MLPELLEILRRDSKQLEIDFERASIEGKGTPQEIADFRENSFQSFIERYYPFPYRVTKGGIFDSFGNRSDSIDCVICNPVHPHTIDTKGKFRLLLADGVDIAVEVKPDLSTYAELSRGLIQGISIKRLRRAKGSGFLEINHPHLYEHSKQLPFVIFSLRAKSDVLSTGKDIIKYYKENNVSLEEQADMVAINNSGIFYNYKFKEHFVWNRSIPDDKKIGWYFEGWGQDTLAGVLFHFQNFPPSVSHIDTPVLKRYFKQMRIDKLIRIDSEG
ncbi:hypothetical protein FE782_22610 [Paenibacillus antri]|uniref:DUF6602 domain-containing protein n=1 Tax=Paenibacillus antri TaxID=2582848 RepID=A0A5R9GAP7_9BACL|nr:DUF6602 domain-containing protein [Paenibacillus antri]TLS49803.1 hypothetical protein FE782_22610 [Paenibacillus antri]